MRAFSFVLMLSAAAVSATLLLAEQKQGYAAEDQTRIFKGVIDQRGSEFVLADSESLEKIAELRGLGWSKDNFARFVGEFVEVKGRMVTERGEKILLVRAIEDIKRTPYTNKEIGLVRQPGFVLSLGAGAPVR
jgi:DNA/RNA endonuclease YhcR with UshA esterase domain